MSNKIKNDYWFLENVSSKMCSSISRCTFRIGRASGNDIHISSTFDHLNLCSDIHCTITLSKNRIWLSNHSPNGTFVNNVKVQNRELYEENVISLIDKSRLTEKNKEINDDLSFILRKSNPLSDLERKFIRGEILVRTSTICCNDPTKMEHDMTYIKKTDLTQKQQQWDKPVYSLPLAMSLDRMPVDENINPSQTEIMVRMTESCKRGLKQVEENAKENINEEKTKEPERKKSKANTEKQRIQKQPKVPKLTLRVRRNAEGKKTKKYKVVSGEPVKVTQPVLQPEHRNWPQHQHVQQQEKVREQQPSHIQSAFLAPPSYQPQLQQTHQQLQEKSKQQKQQQLYQKQNEQQQHILQYPQNARSEQTYFQQENLQIYPQYTQLQSQSHINRDHYMQNTLQQNCYSADFVQVNYDPQLHYSQQSCIYTQSFPQTQLYYNTQQPLQQQSQYAMVQQSQQILQQPYPTYTVGQYSQF